MKFKRLSPNKDSFFLRDIYNSFYEREVIKMKIDLVHLEVKDWMSTITKEVVADFNAMDNKEFMAKYCCSKLTYLKRVMKYGDPYMNAPLARFAKRFLYKSKK